MLIPYIDPPLSRTMENRKPAEKASTQSKFHGDMFPACSRPKKADTITIPTHLPNSRTALYWSTPLNANSSKKPVHIMKISTALIKSVVSNPGKGLGFKIKYSITPMGIATRITPAAIGIRLRVSLGIKSPTSFGRSPCSHMMVMIAINIGTDTIMNQLTKLK